jgi:hypothetical protein
MGIYQAKWATMFNGSDKIVKFSFSPRNITAVVNLVFYALHIFTLFRIAKPPLTPLAMLAYLPLFTPACSTSLDNGWENQLSLFGLHY